MTSLRRSAGILALFVVSLAAATPAFAQAHSAAGRVKVVSGSAFIVRGGDTLAARAGDTVFASDALRTGEGGSVGVTLKDDTRLSLGPNSEVRLERYVYAPGSGGAGTGLKVAGRGGGAVAGPEGGAA